MKKILLCLICAALLAGCGKGQRIEPIGTLTPTRTPKPIEATPTPTAALPVPKARVIPEEMTILLRYNPDISFTRQQTDAGTFSAYLQTLPLKAVGTQLVAYNDVVPEKDDYEAVTDIPVLGKNEQGAGAIAHLRARYFYLKQDYEKISFKLGDGFNFSFEKWRKGNKLKFVEGRATWTTGGTESDDEENFNAYLSAYFANSGLKTLRTDLSEVDVADPIRIGDIFITQGDAARVIVVVDCADNAETGEKIVMLAEGGKPAQPLRLLKNSGDSELSPWFLVDTSNGLVTLGDVMLKTEPYEDGTPARYKFLTDAGSAAAGGDDTTGGEG